MSICKRASNRAGEYEKRTNNHLPLNVLAKLSWVGGVAIFAAEMMSNTSTKEAILPTVMIAGGIVVDKLTGGLGAPYPKNQVEETETN